MDGLQQRAAQVDDLIKLVNSGFTVQALLQREALVALVNDRLGVANVHSERVAQLLHGELPKFFRACGNKTLEAFENYGPSLEDGTLEWNVACAASFGALFKLFGEDYFTRVADLRGEVKELENIRLEVKPTERVQRLAGLLAPRKRVSSRSVRRNSTEWEAGEPCPPWAVATLNLLSEHLEQNSADLRAFLFGPPLGRRILRKLALIGAGTVAPILLFVATQPVLTSQSPDNRQSNSPAQQPLDTLNNYLAATWGLRVTGGDNPPESAGGGYYWDFENPMAFPGKPIHLSNYIEYSRVVDAASGWHVQDTITMQPFEPGGKPLCGGAVLTWRLEADGVKVAGGTLDSGHLEQKIDADIHGDYNILRLSVSLTSLDFECTMTRFMWVTPVLTVR